MCWTGQWFPPSSVQEMPFYPCASLGSLTRNLLESLRGRHRSRILWVPSPQASMETIFSCRHRGSRMACEEFLSPKEKCLTFNDILECWTLWAGPALEFMGKAQKSKLSALGDRANYMSPFKAGWGPMGGRCHTSQQTFSISNDKDSVLQPPCLALRAWACQLPPCCWGGHKARGLGWLDTVTSSQVVLPGTSPQLNCHGGLKKNTQSLVFLPSAFPDPLQKLLTYGKKNQ